MLLRAIQITSLKSIEEASLPSCGRFNVLIGKNNSGKSNVLAAIVGFFGCFAQGDILTLRPAFSETTDWFQRSKENPIRISTILQLEDSELATLISDIQTEHPQILNTVSSLSSSNYLCATVLFSYAASPIGVLAKATLGRTLAEASGEGGTMLFDFPESAISESVEKYIQIAAFKESADQYRAGLRGIEQEAFSRAKREQSSIPLRYYIDRGFPGRIQDDVSRSLEQMFSKAETYPDFHELVLERTMALEGNAANLQKTPIAGSIRTLTGQQHSVPQYITSLGSRLGKTNVLYEQERRATIGPEDAQRLLSLKVQRGGGQQFRALQQTVASLIGVEIDAFAADFPSESASVRRGFNRDRGAELDVDNFLVQANGSGVKEALRLVLDIELNRPDIVLVEEPEVHLHPALETSVMRYLKRKSSECQVFLTSHSTNFIDTGDFSSIYLVKKNGSTKVEPLTADEAADVLPVELGLRLSSLFMYEKLVFVEGQSDEDILREWASTLGLNFSQGAVGFVLIAGGRNVRHFAAQRTTEFLARRGVKMWFLLDRDEYPSDRLEALKRQVGGATANFTELPVREIENLLIIPRTLQAYVADRLSIEANKSFPAPSIEEVRSSIEKHLEALRSYTFAKNVIVPFSEPLGLRPSVESVINGETLAKIISAKVEECVADLKKREVDILGGIAALEKEFDGRWGREKLSIVPGEELLVRILNDFGMTYKKQRDAKRIAATMTEDEIPDLMCRLLKEIASD